MARFHENCTGRILEPSGNLDCASRSGFSPRTSSQTFHRLYRDSLRIGGRRREGDPASSRAEQTDGRSERTGPMDRSPAGIRSILSEGTASVLLQISPAEKIG